MSQLVIVLKRLACEEVTDDFLEGLEDEVGWRIAAWDATGEQSLEREEIPMEGLEHVVRGFDREMDRELARLGSEWRHVSLEFWDEDTFNADDLLGAVEIRRDANGGLIVKAGRTTTDQGSGCFHLSGRRGDYRVWLSITEEE